MGIDDIIEQHKTDLSKREQLRKSKSFSNIFWKNYQSSFSELIPAFKLESYEVRFMLKTSKQKRKQQLQRKEQHVNNIEENKVRFLK